MYVTNRRNVERTKNGLQDRTLGDSCLAVGSTKIAIATADTLSVIRQDVRKESGVPPGH